MERQRGVVRGNQGTLPSQNTPAMDIQEWMRDPVRVAWLLEDRMVREINRARMTSEARDRAALEMEEVD